MKKKTVEAPPIELTPELGIETEETEGPKVHKIPLVKDSISNKPVTKKQVNEFYDNLSHLDS